MAEPDPARAQLWWMTGIRLIGIMLAIFGLWVAGEQPLGAASRFAGLALMLAGAAIVSFASRLLRAFRRQ